MSYYGDVYLEVGGKHNFFFPLFFFWTFFFFFGVIQFAGDIPSHRQSTTVLKGWGKRGTMRIIKIDHHKNKRKFFLLSLFNFDPVQSYPPTWVIPIL